MLIAARNAMMAGGGLSAKDYVQDGLVAMWDGIENVGWRTHNSSATVWKDLIGGRDMLVTGSGAWDDNSLYRASNEDGFVAARQKIAGISHIDLVILPGPWLNERFYFTFSQNQGLLCGLISNSNRRVVKLGGLTSGKAQLHSEEKSYFALSVTPSGYLFKNAVAASLSTRTYKTSDDQIGLLGDKTSYSSYCSSGHVYCVRFYSRALTADEIAANYAVDKARFNLPDA